MKFDNQIQPNFSLDLDNVTNPEGRVNDPITDFELHELLLLKICLGIVLVS
jgi:hypothetical protein